MRTIIRYFLLYLALTSNVHAIVLGTVDDGNIYSSVGYTLTAGGALGSVVALDPNWVLTAAHVVDDPESPPVVLVMGDPNSDTNAEGLYIYIDQVILHPCRPQKLNLVDCQVRRAHSCPIPSGGCPIHR